VDLENVAAIVNTEKCSHGCVPTNTMRVPKIRKDLRSILPASVEAVCPETNSRMCAVAQTIANRPASLRSGAAWSRSTRKLPLPAFFGRHFLCLRGLERLSPLSVTFQRSMVEYAGFADIDFVACKLPTRHVRPPLSGRAANLVRDKSRHRNLLMIRASEVAA
jgi:hypothetical protein